MKANELFLNQPKPFWANVRSISQHLGYTLRGTGQIKVPTLEEMRSVMLELGLSAAHILDNLGQPTELGKMLLAYFEFRADVLNNYVRVRLMDVTRARETFEGLKKTSLRRVHFQ